MEPESSESAPTSSWNTVTPLSKYLAMALFVLLPFAGGYIGYVYGPQEVIEIERVVVKEKRVADTQFDESNDVMMDRNTSAITEFTYTSTSTDTYLGYYTTYTNEAWGETAECNGFVVLSPENETVMFFKDSIRRGNTVQRLSDDGYLMFNLPWESIPEMDKNKIISSSESNPISLRLSKLAQEGRDAWVCESFLSYTGISDVDDWLSQEVKFLPREYGPGESSTALTTKLPWDKHAGYIKGRVEENGVSYIGFDEVKFYRNGGSCSGLNGYCVIHDAQDVIKLELAHGARLTTNGISEGDNPCATLGQVTEPTIKEDALGVPTKCSGIILPQTKFDERRYYWLIMTEDGKVEHIVDQYVP
jgi:hypothetical protein